MNRNGMGGMQGLFAAKSIASSGRGRTASISILGSAGTQCGSAARGDEARRGRAAGVLAKALAAGSDVRMQKVAALKQQIEAGTYHVSALDVAESIIRSMLS